MPNFNRQLILSAIIVFCSLIILTCDNFLPTKETILTIHLSGGGNSRSLIWPPTNDILSQLDYEITLAGNGKETIKKNGKASEKISIPINPGQWQIKVDLLHNDTLYATGERFVTIKAGQRNSISITMSRAFPDDDEVGITISPDNSNGYILATIGNSVQTFNAAVTGTEDTAVTWKLEGGNGKSKLDNITNTSCRLSVDTDEEEGSILKITATSAAYPDKSASVNVKLTEKIVAPQPSISQNLSDMQFIINEDIILEVTVSEIDGILSYQWYSVKDKNKTDPQPISGADSPYFSPPTNKAGIFYYYVSVTNTIYDYEENQEKTSDPTDSNVATLTSVHTITFDLKGGSWELSNTIDVEYNDTIAETLAKKSITYNEPEYKFKVTEIKQSGLFASDSEDLYYPFIDWILDEDVFDIDNETITDDITLEAQWEEFNIEDIVEIKDNLHERFMEKNVTILDQAFSYINDHPGIYTLVLDENIEVAGFSYEKINNEPVFSGVRSRVLYSADTDLTIIGLDKEIIISLIEEPDEESGLIESRIFTVGYFEETEKGNDIENIKLTIGNNITLKGCEDNTRNHLLYVEGAGTCIMDGNAKITGHSAGGVYVQQNGKFIMRGESSICNNTVKNGVDLYSTENPTRDFFPSFIMEGGSSIYNNSGRGVSVGSQSTFTMSGNASIYGNNEGGVTVAANSSAANGNRARIRGTFTMNDNAKVYGHTTSGSGAGVNVLGEFIMNGNAAVYGNTSSANGGGVYVNGSFTMNGNASVYGNITNTGSSIQSGGGGVYVYSGTFIMNNNASVYSNSANATGSYAGGGGVYLSSGSFTMNNNSSLYNNTANANGYGGGGVYSRNTFTMNDNASIFGNKAITNGLGGGVYQQSGIFRLVGGTVYGNDTAETDAKTGVQLKNTADSTGRPSAALNLGGSAYYGAVSTALPILPHAEGNPNGTNYTIRAINGAAPTYTVTFNLNGGSGSFPARDVVQNSITAKPSTDPTKTFSLTPATEGLYLIMSGNYRYQFLGWFDEEDNLFDFSTQITRDITLTAGWQENIDLSNQTGATIIEKAIKYINANAASTRSYVLVLTKNITVSGEGWEPPPTNMFPATRGRELTATYFNLTIIGTQQITINLSSKGRIFTIGDYNNTIANSPILTIGDNIILKGYGTNEEKNTNAVVVVQGSSSFIMEGNSLVTGNIGAEGVLVQNANSKFIMRDNAKITDNHNKFIFGYDEDNKLPVAYEGYGGGVVVVDSGSFEMQDNAEISGNSAISGGGVFIGAGTFRLTGGTIYGNSEFPSSLSNKLTDDPDDLGSITEDDTGCGAALYVKDEGKAYYDSSGETSILQDGVYYTDDTITR